MNVNVNTTTFERVSADPRMSVWENERHEKVVIAPSGKKPIRATRSLLSVMIKAVVEAQRLGQSSVEVADSRGF